jgi:predicted MFS family arabinose efflux permease
VTLRQRLTPPRMLGRAIAASRTISWMGIPIGAALGGFLGDRIGLRPLFFGGGILILVAGTSLVLGPLWRLKPDGFHSRGSEPERAGTEAGHV